MEKRDMKELKEFIEGMMDLSLCFAEVFKDGIQFKDFMSLWEMLGKNPAIKRKFERAIEGYQNIPAEIKDLDAMEGVELASCLITFMPKLIRVLSQEDEKK